MADSALSITDAFSTNRAEELGLDVWDDFVIPLFYDELDLIAAKKARRIVGGRGSGKTMLLRFLSHQSQFSVSRNFSKDDTLENIGLYWRADTNFLTMLKKQGVAEEGWIRIFKHYLTIVTSIEVLKSLESVANSKFPLVSVSDIEGLNFDSLQDYGDEYCGDYRAFYKKIVKKLRICESAIHNPHTINELIMLPDSFVASGLIDNISKQLPAFKNTTFSLFIDEYENLLTYQQKSINTKIKHGQSPLIYHVAMKKNGMETNDTLGEESIQGIADYRTIDLDYFLSEATDIELFSAEIFLQRISRTGALLKKVDLSIIMDKDRVQERLSGEYKKRIISIAAEILPGLSHQEMAEAALNSSSKKNKILSEIDRALQIKNSKTKIIPEDFVVEGFEQATIVVPSLLSRSSSSIDSVYSEWKALIAGEKNKFSGSGGWTANNFVGSYLRLFRTYDRPCPFYSGFQTFVKLSRGNIRHFLELCNAAVLRCRLSPEELIVDVDTQALATRAASEDILNEAPTYGRMGSQLRTFIYNIGHIFEYSQMRRSQSEPEVNHFSIKGGYSALNDEDIKFLNEAEKWGVLYQEKSTKEKDKSNPDSVEWILNPIYAPFFFISYRKKRKIDFNPDQFRILRSGNKDARLSLEKSYRDKWELEESEQPYSYSLL